MADFCKACSEDLFDKDFKELAGVTTAAAWADGRACVVICEGRGYIQVEPDGRCVSPDCLKKGAQGHGCKGLAPACIPDSPCLDEACADCKTFPSGSGG